MIKELHKAGRGMIAVLICDWCGKEFKRQWCFVKGKSKNFCSPKCQIIERREIGFSEETLKKISEANKGHKRNLGYKHTDEWKQKMSEKMKVRVFTEIHRKRISESKKGEKNYMFGRFKELNSNWQGGITPENKKIRNSEQYQNWRIAVFERDKYICQMCGLKGGKLNAHHIKHFKINPKSRFDINNGITLCEKCHKEIHKKDVKKEIQENFEEAVRFIMV